MMRISKSLLSSILKTTIFLIIVQTSILDMCKLFLICISVVPSRKLRFKSMGLRRSLAAENFPWKISLTNLTPGSKSRLVTRRARVELALVFKGPPSYTQSTEVTVGQSYFQFEPLYLVISAHALWGLESRLGMGVVKGFYNFFRSVWQH